jgi:hypothetical protein
MALELKDIYPNMDEVIEYATQKAKEGALDAIKNFYTGYNSPYKKAIEQSLEVPEIATQIDVPDVVALINEKLSAEFDEIANAAVAHTYLPLLKKVLVKSEPIVKFSKILQDFIDVAVYDDADIDEYNVDFCFDSDGSFCTVEITNNTRTYHIRLFDSNFWNKEKKGTAYTLCGLPEKAGDSLSFDSPTMKLGNEEGIVLTLPFRRDVLRDPFIALSATYMVCKSTIVLDTQTFDEDMFGDDEDY